jgi:hypothetical protein
MTNYRFRIHLISGNGLHRKRESSDGPRDRAQLLKYAIFCLVVAAILIVTIKLQRTQSPVSTSRVRHRMLSIVRKLEPNGLSNPAAGGGPYVGRFRLTNQGTQPIFYPLSSDTNRPMGQIVNRVAPQSNWKPLIESEPSPSSQAQRNERGGNEKAIN